MTYTVSKKFEFDYGHRLAKGYKGKCAHPHGHRGVIEVELECESLDQFDMVFDFNELNIIKQWIDDNLDHKMLLWVDDPLYSTLLEFPDVQVSQGLYPCDDNPTAEYIGSLIFELAKVLLNEKVPQGVTVKKITVWETPKCKAEYNGESR